MAAKLGQLLIASNIISEDQLREALILQRKEGGRLGTNLVKLGHITEEKLVTFLSRQYGVPAINLSDYKIDPSVLKLVPVDIARKYLIMPVARVGATLTIAMADPSNVFAIDDVKFMTGYNVEVVVSSESSILSAVSSHYAGHGDALIAAKKSATTQVVQAKDYTLSDEDFKDEEMTTSFDEGFMIDVDEFDRVVDKALDDVEVVEEKEDEAVKEVAQPMANLDIAERRLPQDGRIKLKLGKKREIDFRVSTVPCLFGERTVLRLLDKSNLQVDLTRLGFEEEVLQYFMDALDKPYGMILVTGPTGCGQTTNPPPSTHNR